MHKSMPAWELFKAVFCGAIFGMISSYSILATESLFDGGNGEGIRPSFAVFSQVWDVSQGAYSSHSALSIIFAFFMWFCYLGIAFSFESYRLHLNKMSAGAGGVFVTLIGGLIFVDSYATYNYMTWIVWYYRLLAVGVLDIGIMYFGHFAIVSFFNFLEGMKGKTVTTSA